MSAKGSSGRVLRFAVTGVLLSSPLGCDSAKDAAQPDDTKAKNTDVKTNNARKVEEPAINPGPEPDSADAGATKTGDAKTGAPEDPPTKVNPGPEHDEIEEHVNEGPVEEPIAEPEPEHVNTRKVEEPEPLPKEPKYVNTRKVEEPRPPTKTKPEPKKYVNTRRVDDPKLP